MEGAAMKYCEFCNSEFSPNRKEQRFCSVVCSNQWIIIHRKKLLGVDNPNFGKTHSEDARKKMRAAKLGVKTSAETRAKLSAIRKGKPKSEEWRKAISEALLNSDKLNHAGKNNSNYKHGKYVDERIYRTTLELNSCSECGATEVVFDVHHKDGDHLNNNPENLQVLCHKCHGKKHGRTKGIKETKPRAR